MGKKLSDNEVNTLLMQMADALKDVDGKPPEGETPHGDTALEVARVLASRIRALALAVLTIDVKSEIEQDRKAGL